MKEFAYVIKDKVGIHARPAGEMVKLAKTFSSNITIHMDGKTGDCKKIFTIMSLGVKCQNTVTFQFDGEDEEAAYSAFWDFVNNNL